MNRQRITWRDICFAILVTCGVPLGGVRADERPSVTVFPVSTRPAPFPKDFAKRVGTVIATFLEKGGVQKLDVAEQTFTPPDTDAVDEIARAFARHVADQNLTTQYAVFAQFEGTPPSGVKAIRLVVVDRTGKVVLAETASENELSKATVPPRDPMTCCLFVGQRLQALWKLDDIQRGNAPAGKMAQFWREDAGVPDDAELERMAERLRHFMANRSTSTLTVYPITIDGKSSDAATRDLASLLSESGFGKAQASKAAASTKVSGHSNEQKVLWDTAREFQVRLRRERPPTDYAIFAEYGFQDGRPAYLHAVLCTASGEWVNVEMCNAHHADFRQSAPKTASDLGRLLVSRLRDRT